MALGMKNNELVSARMCMEKNQVLNMLYKFLATYFQQFRTIAKRLEARR